MIPFLLGLGCLLASALFFLAALQLPAVVLACCGALLMGYLLEGDHR